MLQVILNEKEENLTSSFTNLSDLEKEYRKRFNLLDGPAEVGKECTLGNLLIVCLLNYFIATLS